MTTVAKLHKALGQLIQAGHGRKQVCVDKSSFHHPLESDGAVILRVATVEGPAWIGNVDDDGGSKMNRDGTESGSYVVVIKGGQSCPSL